MPFGADVAVDVRWPGAISILSCVYTISHGISPSTATLVIAGQDALPSAVGDLVFDDGNQQITIPDCRVSDVRVTRGPKGPIFTLSIQDRRWKWLDLGRIDGAYNQLDQFGRLIATTIRSPTELAELCMEALGEDHFNIDMPAGLINPQGLARDNIIPTTGTNPPINWYALSPAQALQQLCDLYGRRIIYQHVTNSVLIAPLGLSGGVLPDGNDLSIRTFGPSLKNPAIPAAVAVAGSPTRYQMRLALEAVGLEWDDTYRPINELSYAPLRAGRRQVVRFTIFYDGTSTIPFDLYFTNVAGQSVFPDGQNISARGGAGVDEFHTQDAIAATLNTRINNSQDPRIRGVFTSTVSGNVITCTSDREGVSWQYLGRTTTVPDGHNSIQTELVSSAVAPGRGWDNAPPPTFAGVVETPRLTKAQAIERARQSVFRCYRVKNQDVSGEGRINVPAYGEINIRKQLLIESEQVEQIAPQPGDATLFERSANGDPYTINYYNGFSRCRAAAIYGSICLAVLARANGNLVYVNRLGQNNATANTPADQQLPIPFEIDPVEQVVKFASYVTISEGAFMRASTNLVLQTAVQVRDNETNQLKYFYRELALGGVANVWNVRVSQHPDVQLNIIGRYNAENVITGTEDLEFDPILRATYYLQGHAAQYRLSGGNTVVYNQLLDTQLDATIQQITYSKDGSGFSMTASADSEHSVYVSPYPTRRRAEYLESVQRGQNMTQRLGQDLAVAAAGIVGLGNQ